jgi:hypothetical protein
VHPCLSLTLGPSGQKAHLKRLDDGLMTPLPLTFGSHHPSNRALTCLTHSTLTSTTWTMLISQASHPSIGGRYSEP